MADIQTYLDYILSKVYGKDVRQAIVDAINQCYADATAGMAPVITTEQIAGGTKFTVTVGSVSTSFNVMNGISPQVASASTVSAMTDTDLIYVYTGSETGYVSGDWYYYDGEEWQDGGQYQSSVPSIDSTLTIAGAAADAKATGDAIAAIGGGLTADVKQALMDFARAVAFKDDDPTGQTYIDALEDALYPPVDLVSISAVYTQSGTVYDTDSLNDLKSDLVVTATWSDSSTSTVASNDYTLSGTLTEGTSTITVTYGGKTDTFTVTVTERGALYPLANGTYDDATTNPVYRITVSNGNHVKFEVLRSVSQQSFANLHNGGLSNSATIINNLSELFVIPASAEATLTISNVVNSNSVSFNCNFRKANATTSGSFEIGDGAHLSGEIVTKTLSADESVSCAFFYHVQAPATVGSVIEFDMSFTVNGAKYI